MTLDYYKVQLKKVAEELSEFKKGILAVDESTKTIGKRLFDIDVENTEETVSYTHLTLPTNSRV